MTRFKCGKKEPCVRCGDCCHIRDKIDFSSEEDLYMRKAVYANSKILYLFPMTHYTITISTEEKAILEAEAKKLGIKISILPKKVAYDSAKDKAYVLDWFIDHDICPFYDEEGKCCGIYESRPQICKDFPKLPENKDMEVVRKFREEHSVYCDLGFTEVMEKAKKVLNVCFSQPTYKTHQK